MPLIPERFGEPVVTGEVYVDDYSTSSISMSGIKQSSWLVLRYIF